MKRFINISLSTLSRCSPFGSSPLYNSVNIENHLEEITSMTRKSLVLFIVVTLMVLFSAPIFSEEKKQETAVKTVTYDDLLEQKKAIESLRASYSKISADYNAVCKEKVYQTMNDYPKEECDKKFAQVAKTYSELKKEVESYNKNVEQFQAASTKGK